MLMYIGLVQLVAEDFSRRELPGAAACSTSSPSPSHNSVDGEDTIEAAKAKAQREATLPHTHSHNHDHGGHVDSQPWVFPSMHVALALGCAFMSLLAIWA
jgi:hypothetical protein